MRNFQKLLPILFLLFSLQDLVAKEKASGNINWLSLEEVEKLNKENSRPIFFDFYNKSCKYCKKMDRDTFSDPKIAQYINENYYAVKINAEHTNPVMFNGKTTSNREIARNLKLRGFPSFAFFDQSFKLKKVEVGYKKPKSFLKILKKHQ